MHFFKHLLLLLSLTFTSFLFIGCGGGEADYSFDEVLEAQRLLTAEDLINGDITFLTPGSVVVNENSQSITTLVADANENITYSIVGGDDKDLFAIDARTGSLSFVADQAYIVGGDNIYEVVVGVTTASGTLSTMTMLVKVVKDITKTEPTLDYVAQTVQTVVTTNVITKIQARPADETSSVTFSIVGNDKDIFTIDAEGNIRFKQPIPEYVADKKYIINVLITDGYGNSITTDPIEISLVANLDLIRPIIETDTVSIVENALGSEQIIVTALGTGKVNSYLLNGTDKGFFKISSSGVLSFVAAQDFESAQTTFAITLIVGDDKGNVSDEKLITVNLVDIDEGFTFQTFSDFTPMEGIKAVGTVAATPNTLDNVTPTYKLIQGSTLLQIDAQGNITFKDVAKKGDVITVQVSIESQLHGSLTLSKVFSVSVVDDPTKLPPVLNQNYVTVQKVTAPIDTTSAIVTLQASPAGDSTTLTYSTSGADASKFTVDSSGNLYFASSYDYYAQSDANADNVYEVVIIVIDENGNSTTTDTIKVTLNENPDTMKPVITSSTFSLNENSDGSLFILVSTPGNGVVDSYTIVPGADSTYFEFSNGFLHFITAPDYETPLSVANNNSYHVTLRVSDDLGNDSETKEIIVNVQDVDETLNFTTLASFSHIENSTTVDTITATPKLSMTTTMTYSIGKGTDASKFSIDANSGVLSFITAPSYVASGKNVYTLTIFAQSQYNGSLTESDTITVTVMPASSAITFDSDQSEATLAQNSNVSFPMTATSAAGETLTYSLEEGYDASIFSINANTGWLSIQVPAYRFSTDTEANTYRAAVVASDNKGHSARRQGVLYLEEVDGIPKFTSSTALAISENTKILSSVTGFSPINSPITFTIDGGADAALFSLNVSGALSFTYAPNYENPQDQNGDNVYEVNVRITDDLYAVNTATQTILVTVTNLLDAPTGIVFVSTNSTSVSVKDGSHIFFIPTNTKSYENVTAITSPSNGTLTYSLVSNPDTSIFSISSSGELKVDSPPFSSNQLFTLVVRVSETNGEFSDQTLYVTILD